MAVNDSLTPFDTRETLANKGDSPGLVFATRRCVVVETGEVVDYAGWWEDKTMDKTSNDDVAREQPPRSGLAAALRRCQDTPGDVRPEPGARYRSPWSRELMARNAKRAREGR